MKKYIIGLVWLCWVFSSHAYGTNTEIEAMLSDSIINRLAKQYEKHYKKAEMAFFDKNYKKIKRGAEKCLKLGNKVNNPFWISKAYNLFGVYYQYEEKDYEVAIRYYELAVDSWSENDKTCKKAQYMDNIARVYYITDRKELTLKMISEISDFCLSCQCVSYGHCPGNSISYYKFNLIDTTMLNITPIDSIFKYDGKLIDFYLKNADTINVVSQIGDFITDVGIYVFKGDYNFNRANSKNQTQLKYYSEIGQRYNYTKLDSIRIKNFIKLPDSLYIKGGNLLAEYSGDSTWQPYITAKLERQYADFLGASERYDEAIEKIDTAIEIYTNQTQPDSTRIAQCLLDKSYIFNASLGESFGDLLNQFSSPYANIDSLIDVEFDSLFLTNRIKKALNAFYETKLYESYMSNSEAEALNSMIFSFELVIPYFTDGNLEQSCDDEFSKITEQINAGLTSSGTINSEKLTTLIIGSYALRNGVCYDFYNTERELLLSEAFRNNHIVFDYNLTPEIIAQLDKYLMASIYKDKALYYYNTPYDYNAIDSALLFFEKYLNSMKTPRFLIGVKEDVEVLLGYNKDSIYAYNMMAELYWSVGECENAVFYSNKAVDIYKKIRHPLVNFDSNDLIYFANVACVVHGDCTSKFRPISCDFIYHSYYDDEGNLIPVTEEQINQAKYYKLKKVLYDPYQWDTTIISEIQELIKYYTIQEDTVKLIGLNLGLAGQLRFKKDREKERVEIFDKLHNDFGDYLSPIDSICLYINEGLYAYYVSKDFDKAEDYYDIALEIGQWWDVSDYEEKIYRKLTSIYYECRNDLTDYGKQLYLEYTKKSSTHSLSDRINHLTYAYMLNNQLDSALIQFDKLDKSKMFNDTAQHEFIKEIFNSRYFDTKIALLQKIVDESDYLTNEKYNKFQNFDKVCQNIESYLNPKHLNNYHNFIYWKTDYYKQNGQWGKCLKQAKITHEVFKENKKDINENAYAYNIGLWIEALSKLESVDEAELALFEIVLEELNDIVSKEYAEIRKNNEFPIYLFGGEPSDIDDAEPTAFFPRSPMQDYSQSWYFLVRPIYNLLKLKVESNSKLVAEKVALEAQSNELDYQISLLTEKSRELLSQNTNMEQNYNLTSRELDRKRANLDSISTKYGTQTALLIEKDSINLQLEISNTNLEKARNKRTMWAVFFAVSSFLAIYFGVQTRRKKERLERKVQENEQLQQSILKQNDQLTEQNQFIEKHIRDYSHTYRNGLQSILNRLSYLSDERYADNPVVANDIEKVEQFILDSTEIYSLLYEGKQTDENIRGFINSIFDYGLRTHQKQGVEIRRKMDVDDATIPRNIVRQVGMIINEAIRNSCKHAFTHETENPTISITYKVKETKHSIVVADNGRGFNRSAVKLNESSGLSLMESFCDGLSSKLNIETDNGTKYFFTIDTSLLKNK